jgi:hypothetical protein
MPVACLSNPFFYAAKVAISRELTKKIWQKAHKKGKKKENWRLNEN